MRFVRGQSEIKWDAKSRAARRPPHVAAAMAVAARDERVHAVTLGAIYMREDALATRELQTLR